MYYYSTRKFDIQVLIWVFMWKTLFHFWSCCVHVQVVNVSRMPQTRLSCTTLFFVNFYCVCFVTVNFYYHDEMNGNQLDELNCENKQLISGCLEYKQQHLHSTRMQCMGASTKRTSIWAGRGTGGDVRRIKEAYLHTPTTYLVNIFACFER